MIGAGKEPDIIHGQNPLHTPDFQSVRSFLRTFQNNLIFIAG